jgi:hypothetical protein
VDGTIVLTTLGLVGIPTPTPVSTTVSDNFDGASIDSNKWGLWRSGSSTRVEQKNGKTEFEFLGASTAYRSGELWGKQIWGDFVASVDVSRISGGLPTGSDAHLVFRDVRDWDNSLQMFVRVESSNSVSIISGYVLSEQWTELNRKTFPGLGPFTLRIKRTGSNAKWEIKEGNSFVELASASDVFKGPGIVMLQSNSWEPGFPAALSTFDNFSVEGSQSNACLAYPTMDTFTVGKINKELWNIFSWDQNTNVVESDGKLRTAKAGSTNAGQARISSKKQLCGDFDVSVDFDSLTSIAADTSVGSLYVEDAGFASTVQKGSGLYIEMQRNKTGSQHIGTDFWVNDVPSGQYKAVDFPGNSGRLRIRRTGSTYTTYYSDGGTWKQLAQFQSPQLAAPVFLSLGVGSWDPDHPPVSANFDNVNIQSASAVSATAVQSTGINTSVSPPPSINYGTMIQSSAIKHLGN